MRVRFSLPAFFFSPIDALVTGKYTYTMIQTKRLFLPLLTLLILPTLALAQATKAISLKDGSTLKGELVKFENGIYTIKTSNLGEVKLPEADVVGISSGEMAAPQTISQPALMPSGNAQIKSQVDQMKGKLMSDPAMMQNVQELMDDEEIRALISDPQLIQDMMSYDPERMRSNPKMQELMNNPKMQSIMNKAVQNLPAQP